MNLGLSVAAPYACLRMRASAIACRHSRRKTHECLCRCPGEATLGKQKPVLAVLAMVGCWICAKCLGRRLPVGKNYGTPLPISVRPLKPCTRHVLHTPTFSKMFRRASMAGGLRGFRSFGCWSAICSPTPVARKANFYLQCKHSSIMFDINFTNEGIRHCKCKSRLISSWTRMYVTSWLQRFQSEGVLQILVVIPDVEPSNL